MNYFAIVTILVFLTTSIDSKHKHKHDQNEPEFMKNLTKSEKKSFFEISKNPGLSVQQIEDKLEDWAKENEVKDQYDKFVANKTAHKAELSKNVTEVVSRLAEAKTQVDKIFEDKTKTKIQQQDAIKELTKKYPQEIPTLFFIGKQFGQHDHDSNNKKDSKEGKKGNRHRDRSDKSDKSE